MPRQKKPLPPKDLYLLEATMSSLRRSHPRQIPQQAQLRRPKKKTTDGDFGGSDDESNPRHKANFGSKVGRFATPKHQGSPDKQSEKVAPHNNEVEQLLNRKIDLYSAVALLSNSLVECSSNEARKKVADEIAAIETELTPISTRLEAFFQTKQLPAAPEPPKPKFDPTNEADCLRRRNALQKKKSILRKKQIDSPEDLSIQDQINDAIAELAQIKELLEK